MVGIQYIESFFPEGVEPVSDLIRTQEREEEFTSYFSNVGIDKVSTTETLTGYDLAKIAGENLIARNCIDKQKISMVILIQSRLPDFLISSEAARLQFELGLFHAKFLSVSGLGCADITMAIKVAVDFLNSNSNSENVLICFGSKAYVPDRFRYPVTVNGDGGIALFLSSGEGSEILDVDFKMDGRYWDLFCVDYRNGRYDTYREKCKDLRTYAFELALESRSTFSLLNKDMLERNDLTKEEIAHYLMQNISSRAYEYYEEAFDIRISDACRYNLRNHGHLGPMDIGLNFKTCIDNSVFQKNDYVMIMNNSPVAVWSSILLRI